MGIEITNAVGDTIPGTWVEVAQDSIIKNICPTCGAKLGEGCFYKDDRGVHIVRAYVHIDRSLGSIAYED